MRRFVIRYIAVVDAINYRIGRVAMYGIFVLIGILLWSSVSKVFFLPSLRTLEMAQFAMVAYYILGGPYCLQQGSDVRMDLFYSSWTARQRAWVDAFTVFFLMFYLGVLLYGGIDSTVYAFEYGERSYSAWRPYMWPIKLVTCIGIFLMLLQSVSELFKDIAKIKGVEI
ncbi:MAG: TRAP transporter small permease subunit [Haliea sp.]|nr:TRAP transporter small permease subunit [Haliea sp.]